MPSSIAAVITLWEMTEMRRTAVYPGSFNPPTVAHVHIAECVIEQLNVDVVYFTISSMTLGKDDARLDPIDDRLDELTMLFSDHPQFEARETSSSLIADIAEGFDVIVVGADKWLQVVDPVWYGDTEARDEALRRLPTVAIAPRSGYEIVEAIPDVIEAVILDTDPLHHPISATAVRAGKIEWRAKKPS